MESTSQTLGGLIDCLRRGIDPVGIVASGPSILDVVPCLELFETFGASIVDIWGVGDKLRRGRRSVGSRHFKWRTG